VELAGSDRRLTRMRRSAALLVPPLALAVLLGGCGTATVGTAGPSPDPTTGAPGADGDTELVAEGIVMQSGPQARVEICIGPVLTSYPPQCGGPGLVGEFSWDDVDAQEQGGVRWSDATYFAVGRFDPEADVLVLTRPLSTEPPEGLRPPKSPPLDFPQLCDDPFRGGDPDFTEDFEAQERLQQTLEGLDGYVSSWVSDGNDLFNVVVSGEPEAAHERLREVWPGGLCVEQRDLPSAEDVAAAQAALGEVAQDIGLITSAGAATGGLDVEVVVADEATTERVREVVSPWLEPDHVSIRGAMLPLEPLSQG
jgi:hypothetical protein